jgi:hypothetical protein
MWRTPTPGQLLCQDTFYVGRIKGVGRIYLQAMVDTYCSLAFGKLHTSKRPETTVDPSMIGSCLSTNSMG